jgi:hypothetical protein
VTGWLGRPPEFNRVANEVLKAHLSAIVLAAEQAPSWMTHKPANLAWPGNPIQGYFGKHKFSFIRNIGSYCCT